MKVLFAASECAPIVKVGGLGDVAGSLPKALDKLGIGVSVAIPGYQTIDFTNWELLEAFAIHFAGSPLKIEVFRTVLAGTKVAVFAFREDRFIASGGIYFSKTAFASSQDEINRFLIFNLALAAWIGNGHDFDIIHANDWQTGLLFHLLNDAKISAKTIFTIHNLANQGISSLDIDGKMGGHINHDRLLAWDAADDNLDFMLQAVGSTDWITTVSPNYAKEILTPAFGEGLNEVLLARQGRIEGILNGLDTDVWNPAADRLLPSVFDQLNYSENRRKNKISLQGSVGLPVDTKLPLFGFIGRLTDQKGLNLIISAMPYLRHKAQVMLLGQGQAEIEKELARLASETDGRVVYVNTEENYHEDYEHLMYGACDFFLVPSKFEPCGLVQMIAMHYGAVPIAHAVGGLKDTIDDGETGFLFEDFSPASFGVALDRALSAWENVKISPLIRQGMSQDFSWSKSAAEYVKLYEKAVREK